MLTRRNFMKTTAVLSLGAVLPLSMADTILAAAPPPRPATPPRRFLPLQGHKRSGCAFHPEKVDIWAGGGAVVPEDF
ncbi:MAG: twin-arginine translocation signal domain-containing protein [candidate division Zixibacteria bacterium]|nr:twin-arginine translocation signal domain-containing protein [candidate division Zixibacteria bacterium]